MRFGDRLAAAFEARGQLSVGIDPHAYLLRDWGLTDDAAGLREFGLRVVDAAAGLAAIVKPQVAFFERHGASGYAALEEVIQAARASDLLVLADTKRGDVGSSVEAYGEAWLRAGSALEVDAMTISAFQGFGSIEAPLALAERDGKGLFVLAATSNPEAAAIQTAVIQSGPHGGMTVAAGIVAEVTKWNRARAEPQHRNDDGEHAHGHERIGLGNTGVVLGATVDFAEYGIDLDTLAGHAVKQHSATPILAPGFGHQGARFDQLGELYGAAAAVTIVSASRSILSAGPSGIAAAIDAQTRELAAWRA